MYLWLIHIVVWQKPTQHCKAIILQFKRKDAPYLVTEIPEYSVLSLLLGNNDEFHYTQVYLRFSFFIFAK